MFKRPFGQSPGRLHVGNVPRFFQRTISLMDSGNGVKAAGTLDEFADVRAAESPYCVGIAATQS